MIRLIPIICSLKLRKRRHNLYDTRKQVSCCSFLLIIDYGPSEFEQFRVLDSSAKLSFCNF